MIRYHDHHQELGNRFRLHDSVASIRIDDGDDNDNDELVLLIIIIIIIIICNLYIYVMLFQIAAIDFVCLFVSFFFY